LLVQIFVVVVEYHSFEKNGIACASQATFYKKLHNSTSSCSIHLNFSGLVSATTMNILENFRCKKSSMKEVMGVGMQTRILLCASTQLMACKNNILMCRRSC